MGTVIGQPTWMGWYYVVARGTTAGTFALQRVHVLGWGDRATVYAFEQETYDGPTGDEPPDGALPTLPNDRALPIGIPTLVHLVSLMHESAVKR